MLTVVVAGDAPVREGLAANAAAAELGLPLLAEPSSNARFGAALRHEQQVAARFASEVERVVVCGHPTLSRPVNALLAREDIEILHDFAGVGPGGADWLAAWREADAAIAETAPAFAVTLAQTTGPLFLGNSRAIRYFSQTPVPPAHRPVYANRGLSGIDGELSTAIGLALALGEPALAVLGDLTFLHDLNALAIPVGEPRPDLRVVVLDDNGGSIFAQLEYGRPEFDAVRARLFTTPTGVDIAAVVAAIGIPVARATAESLPQALARPPAGIEVVVLSLC
jgi:2-succinyl-5-enolpyruvyl-6-hydroxy-3-cyclohexene-1-carboxylate synthase